MKSSTAWVMCSGFAVMLAWLLGEVATPVVALVFIFGGAVLWTLSFMIGLARYGTPALWLLAVAPLAFYKVAAAGKAAPMLLFFLPFKGF